MNEFTHFITGYLVARAMKYKVNRFESFFVAFSALIIDIDYTINLFVPFEHGVVTHTLLGGFLLILAFTAITYPVASSLLQKTGTSFKRLLLLGVLGMLSHLALDSFTWHEGPCSIWLNPATMPGSCTCPGTTCVSVDDHHHLYFWPFWNFPPHINTMFPFTWMTYEIRVYVEVIYTVAIATILIVQLLFKKQNFFTVFWPPKWMSHVPGAGQPSGAGNAKIKLPAGLIIWEISIFAVYALQYFRA